MTPFTAPALACQVFTDNKIISFPIPFPMSWILLRYLLKSQEGFSLAQFSTIIQALKQERQ